MDLFNKKTEQPKARQNLGVRRDTWKKGGDVESFQPEMEEAGKQHGQYRIKVIKP